jgi:hypothetical protein
VNAREGNYILPKDEFAGELFVPSGMRPYVSFKSATVLVLLLVTLTACLRAFVKFSPEQVSMYAEQNRLVHSATFLISYNVFVALCFIGIYATRRFRRYYYLRVAFYTMVLTGFLIQWVSIVLPLRSS